MVGEIRIPIVEELITRIERLEGENTLIKNFIRGLNSPKKEWYSVKEAAIYLNVSPVTIRRKVKENILKKSLGIRHIKIPLESLINYKKTTVV